MGVKDFILLIIIFAAVICAVVYIIRHRGSCSGNCSGCSGVCCFRRVKK